MFWVFGPSLGVIPAKAGIPVKNRDSRFRGNDTVEIGEIGQIDALQAPDNFGDQRFGVFAGAQGDLAVEEQD